MDYMQQRFSFLIHIQTIVRAHQQPPTTIQCQRLDGIIMEDINPLSAPVGRRISEKAPFRTDPDAAACRIFEQGIDKLIAPVATERQVYFFKMPGSGNIAAEAL